MLSKLFTRLFGQHQAEQATPPAHSQSTNRQRRQARQAQAKQTAESPMRMLDKICITRLNGLLLNPGKADNRQLALTLQAEAMALGYIFDADLLQRLASQDESQLTVLFHSVIPILRHLTGADVRHQPLYPNFPQQVADMDYCDLFWTALDHYWSEGEWRPAQGTLPRDIAFEGRQFTSLGLVNNSEVDELLTNLLSINESLSEEDRIIVEWLLANRPDAQIPAEIPFKETMCLVAAHRLQQGLAIDDLVWSGTDVLRVITHLSDGDVSLAENTRFKSLPRQQRRMFCALLENLLSEEDLKRHHGKWVRVLHNLHVGDHSQTLYALAKKARNNEPLDSFNAQVERAIRDQNLKKIIGLLSRRPGEFARRLDQLLRSHTDAEHIIGSFDAVCDRIPTRVLLQLLGHMRTRRGDTDKRIVFPKGQSQKAIAITGQPALSPELYGPVMAGVQNTLCKRFAELPALGKVWIDPFLATAPVPTAQRSASASLRRLARGTRLPLTDADTLRLFIYWIGKDIDLSATMHDAKLRYMSHISYTSLKSDSMKAYHSGDIVDAPAPQGASEFIDISIDGALKKGVRYIAMHVMVYNGPAFAKHERCFAGWMGRKHPRSNEVFEPRTVEQRLDLTVENRNAIPVVFDLQRRQAIWCDLATRNGQFRAANNVESNLASIGDTLAAIIEKSNKVSLYDLFCMHAVSRGSITDKREEADLTVAFDGDITPYDVTRIASDFMA